jgi:hypothetical protein
VRAIGRLTKPREVDGTTVKGINFFEPGDSALLHALQNPGVNMAASAGRISLQIWQCSRPASCRDNCAAAGHRGYQARHRDVSLLPDQGRSRCHHRSRAAQAGNYCSGYDLIGYWHRQ